MYRFCSIFVIIIVFAFSHKHECTTKYKMRKAVPIKASNDFIGQSDDDSFSDREFAVTESAAMRGARSPEGVPTALRCA